MRELIIGTHDRRTGHYVGLAIVVAVLTCLDIIAFGIPVPTYFELQNSSPQLPLTGVRVAGFVGLLVVATYAGFRYASFGGGLLVTLAVVMAPWIGVTLAVGPVTDLALSLDWELLTTIWPYGRPLDLMYAGWVLEAVVWGVAVFTAGFVRRQFTSRTTGTIS